MASANDTDAGVVSGLFNTSQQVGGALGVAVLSTLAGARTDHLLAAGQSRAAALTGGYHVAFAIGTGLLVTAFVLTISMLRRRTGGAAPAADGFVASTEAPATRR
jgi:hypothetical protein